MRPLAAKQKTSSYAIVAFTLWIELTCGLEATAWTALYRNPNRNIWINQIFIIYLIFGVTLMYLTGAELWTRLKQTTIKSTTLNWLWVICTAVTFGVFKILSLHNDSYDLESGILISDKAYCVFILALILFPMIYTCCTSISSVEKVPFLVFVILFQLGIGGLATFLATIGSGNKEVSFKIAQTSPDSLAMAYVFLGIDMLVPLTLLWVFYSDIWTSEKRNDSKLVVILFWSCRICTVLTGIVFKNLWIGPEPFHLFQGEYYYEFGLFIYSCYFLISLELMCLASWGTTGTSAGDDCFRSDVGYEIATSSI